MPSIQRHAGDGNVRRSHHVPVQLYFCDLLVQELDDDEGRWFRLSSEYGEIDLTPEQWDGLRREINAMRRGPKPEIREAICDVLAEAFEEKDTWPVMELTDLLKERGLSTNHVTLRAARRALDIETVPDYGSGGGVTEWVWTNDQNRIDEYARRKAARKERSASRGRASSSVKRSTPVRRRTSASPRRTSR